MNTMHRLVAACLLLAAAPAWSAAPPLGPTGLIARLGHVRMVAAPNQELGVSPDGKYVFSSSSWYGQEPIQPGRWFRLSDGRQATPPVHVPAGYVLLRIFPSGRYLVGKEGRLLLFDPAIGKAPSIIELGKQPLFFDPSGRWCVKLDTKESGALLSWAKLGQPGPVRWRRLATLSDSLYDLRLSEKTGRAVWVLGDRKHIHIQDLDSKKVTTLDTGGKEGQFDFVAISPDGRWAAWQAHNGLHLLDVDRGRWARTIPLSDLPRFAPQFTPDSKSVAVLSRTDEVRLIPLTSGGKETVAPLIGSAYVERFAFFPDGKRIAVQDGASVIRIHDLATGKQLDPHSRFPSFRAVRIVGKDTAACWGDGGLVVLWDMRTGRILSEARVKVAETEKDLVFVEFAPDGASVLCRTGKRGCLIADSKTGKVTARLTAEAEDAYASFHLLGKSVAILDQLENDTWLSWVDPLGHSKRRIPLGEPRNPDLPRPAPTGGWLPPRFSPDGRAVLCSPLADPMGRFALYEAASGKVRWSKELPRGYSHEALFDRKGRWVVVIGDRLVNFASGERRNEAVVYDVLTGKELVVVTGCSPDAVLSPSGRWLASNLGGKGIALWDLDAKFAADPVLRWAPPKPAAGIALDENGKRLVAVHADGTCFVWNLEVLRARRGKTLDVNAWERLGAADPAEAVPAMAALVKIPGRAVRLLAGKLAPVPEVSRKRIAEWIAQLDANAFEKRSAAEQRLEEHREQAEGLLREAAAAAPLEARLRLRRLLRPLDERHKDAAWLRQVRAIEVLERIGSPDAIALLKKLAGGAAGAALTREAREALERLR